MEPFPWRPSSTKQPYFKSDEFKRSRLSEPSFSSFCHVSGGDVAVETGRNLVSVSTTAEENHVKLPIRQSLGGAERWPRRPSVHLPPLDTILFKTKKNQSKTEKFPETRKNKTKHSTSLADKTETSAVKQERKCFETSNYFGRESIDIFQSDRLASYRGIRKRDHESDLQENMQTTHVDGVGREKKPSDYGRRRRFKPASTLCSDTEEAGIKIPFPPRRAQSNFKSSSTSCHELLRENQEFCCENSHETEKTFGDEPGPNDTGRRRKLNIVSFAYSHATRDSAEAKMQSDVVRRSNAVNHNAFQKEQDESRCIQKQEKEERCDADNRDGGVGRRSKFNPTSACYKEEAEEEVYLPLPPSYHAPPRDRPSRRSQRMAVCDGAEDAAVTRERTRARVLRKRFGDLTLSDTETSRNLRLARTELTF